MAQFTTHAIVVRRADYRENDRMLTLFSPTIGRIDALCRGCRRQKSPLMAAGELFCAGEYVLYRKADRVTVVSCTVTDTYYALREDYDALSHGMYMLELSAAVIQPDQENERLFLLLLRSLAHLCYGQTSARRVTAVFIMGMVSLLGFRPAVTRCAVCGAPIAGTAEERTLAAFSVEHGGLLCPRCGAGERYRLSGREVAYLQRIMKTGLASLEEDGQCTDGVFEALRRLAQEHIETPIQSGKLLL